MKRRGRSAWPERCFSGLCLLALLLPLGFVLALLGQVVWGALARPPWDFLTGYPARQAERAGIFPALVGSALLLALTACMALPAGVGAAIYLEEYGKQRRLDRWIEANIDNLACVPSVIYGLLGLGLFVRAMGLGRSVLAGALTLSLFVLPLVIISARAALRAVPEATREASLALGATRWQVLRRVVLPMAAPGILSGSIFALSRAAGEAAPLVVLGGMTMVTFLPDGSASPFTALPLQIFSWSSRPDPEFIVNAAAGSLVLLLALLLLNMAALLLRGRQRGRG